MLSYFFFTFTSRLFAMRYGSYRTYMPGIGYVRFRPECALGNLPGLIAVEESMHRSGDLIHVRFQSEVTRVEELYGSAR